jgi:hypothetical protein
MRDAAVPAIFVAPKKYVRRKEILEECAVIL